ncbi:MAG: hypothetical protein ABIH28_02885 [archaeon]
MGFKFFKGLERTVLGITGALIIAGTPLYSTSQGFAQRYVGNQYLAFEEGEEIRYRAVLDVRKNKILSIITKKGVDSLELTFEISEPEYNSPGKRKDSIHLTPLNPGFSRFVIFSPKGVKISKVEQEAYFLPQEKFVKLVPLSEARFAKKVLKIGKNLIGSITPWGPINPVQSKIEDLIDSSEENDKKMYSAASKKLENEFGRPYSFENIEFFQAEGIRGNERARRIKTFFDVGELEGRGNIEALVRPAAGTSSSDIQIKEWLEINFSIQGGKLPAWIKKQEIGAESMPGSEYLLHVLMKRGTRDVGVYDPQRKKTIIYSFDEEEFAKLDSNKKRALKEKELYLSIEKDLEKERLSEQTIFVIELGGPTFNRSTMNEFREICKRYEKRR